MIDEDKLRADLEAATDGPWGKNKYGSIGAGNHFCTPIVASAEPFFGQASPCSGNLSLMSQAPTLAAAYLEQAERIRELEKALWDVREDICTGPLDDTLWHQGSPAETTVDFICNTLKDDWDYDQWLEDHATPPTPAGK